MEKDIILGIIEAKYLQDYKVQVVFNDGKEGVVDLSDALRGLVFDPLKDKKLFAQLYGDKEMETIAWLRKTHPLYH